MQRNPFDAAQAAHADRDLPEFVLLDSDQVLPPQEPVVRPEDTIDTQFISYVRFYDGTVAYSFKQVPGCAIHLPPAVFTLKDAGMTLPLFNLACTMSFVTEPGHFGPLHYKPAQARTQVFYSAPELCSRAAELYRALALHTELCGVVDWGDVGEIECYSTLTRIFEELPDRHFDRFGSGWLAPADIDFWARELDNDLLYRMSDRMVISEAVPL